MHASTPFRIVVLLSGNGSNLQAIIDAIENQTLPAEISAVISNRPDAYGLERAKTHGIATHVIDHTKYADRQSFDKQLAQRIDHYQPDLVVLAGFMRILTDDFVNHYSGRMINIHPSLLPAYQGLNTHQRVLEDGCTEHGATVHFVIPKLDSGPIILQARIPVTTDDSVKTLQQRVHAIEHRLYPEAIRRIATGQVRFSNGVVYYNDNPITAQDWQFTAV